MNNKYINVQNVNNRYNLDPQSLDKIISILEDYLFKLDKISTKKLSLREQLSLLGLIAELFPLLDKPEKYLEISHTLLLELREHIYHQELNNISLYDGLANLAVFLKILNINSGCYSNFYKIIEDMINSKSDSLVDVIISKDKISFFDYDVISGISGITNYLLNQSSIDAHLLKKIDNYLVSLGTECNQNGEKHICWVKKSENSSTHDYLDFSLSHGIAGPLLVITRLYKNNIIIPGQVRAIKNILYEYEYIASKAGVNIWSGKVNKEIYFHDKMELQNLREGWCYGTASVSMVLLEAASICNNESIYKKAYSQLCEVAKMTVEEMYLTNEILCHGYAGMAALYRILYDLYKEPLFEQKARYLLKNIIEAYTPNSKYGSVSEDVAFYNGIRVTRSCDKIDFLEGNTGAIIELSSWIKDSSNYEEMLMLKSF